LEYIRTLKDAGLYVQGTEDPEVNFIRVISNDNLSSIITSA